MWTKSLGRLPTYLLVGGSGLNIVHTCSLFYYYFLVKKKKRYKTCLPVVTKKWGFQLWSWILDMLPRGPWIWHLDVLPRGPMVWSLDVLLRGPMVWSLVVNLRGPMDLNLDVLPRGPWIFGCVETCAMAHGPGQYQRQWYLLVPHQLYIR